MRFARIAGRRVAYAEYGDPRGRPVLIIHGAWGGPSSTLWTGPRLRWDAPTDGLRLICYDRRCAGWSEYAETDFTLADLARDAVGLLNHLNIKQAAVIATSAGGPIGLRLALDAPERVSALALLNTGAALMHPNPSLPRSAGLLDRLATVRERLAMLDLAERAGVRAAVLAYESEWRTPPQAGFEQEEEEAALAAALRHRAAALTRLPQTDLIHLAAGALRNMHAQRNADLTPELERIAVPTLVVHGDADTTIPIEFGQHLAAKIPTAKFLPLPAHSHGLIRNANAQTLLTKWLRAML